MLTHINKKRRFNEAIKGFHRMATEQGTQPENIALTVVEEKKPIIQRWVKEHGEKPYDNPAMLAAQATLLHENKIWQKMQKNAIPDYFDAENAVMAEEQHQEDSNYFDDFDGGILGAVLTAGDKALDRINAKRTARGKKPILAGERGKKLREKVKLAPEFIELKKGGIATGANSESDIAIIKDELINEIRRRETKEAVKKYLPLAIIVLVAVFFIGKSMK